MTKLRPSKSLMVTLPAELVEAINKYNVADWPSGSIGSLNAVAFIGEQVAAIVAVKTRLCAKFPAPRWPAKTEPSATAGLVKCGNCEIGFRRVNGIHIGSQRLGMIPDTACDAVFATHGGSMTEDNTKPWMAHVDGEPLRKASGDARRFATAATAYRAALKAAPRRWHS